MSEAYPEQFEDLSEFTDPALAKSAASLVSGEANFGQADQVFQVLLSKNFIDEAKHSQEQIAVNQAILAELGMRLLAKAGVLQDVYPAEVRG